MPPLPRIMPPSSQPPTLPQALPLLPLLQPPLPLRLPRQLPPFPPSRSFNVDLTCHRLRRRRLRRRLCCHCRRLTAAATAATVAAAAATNTVSVAIAAICWLLVVCPRCCLCFCRRCLFPPLPLLAADVISQGGNCGNGCSGNGGSGDDRAFRSFSGVMFKILHI
jgi:hypothetical protein